MAFTFSKCPVCGTAHVEGKPCPDCAARSVQSQGQRGAPQSGPRTVTCSNCGTLNTIAPGIVAPGCGKCGSALQPKASAGKALDEVMRKSALWTIRILWVAGVCVLGLIVLVVFISILINL